MLTFSAGRCALAAATLAAVALAAMPDPASATKVLETTQSGLWTISALADDYGRFQACNVGSAMLDGTAFDIWVGRDFIAFSLFNETWNLPVGRNYPVTIQIDQRYRSSFPAEVVNARLLSIDLGLDEDFLLSFTFGNRLHILPSRGDGWTYSL